MSGPQVGGLPCNTDGDIWFTYGGVRDIRQLFTDLRREQVDALDDGTVVDHRNLNEVAAASANKDGVSRSGGQSLR